MPAPHRRPPPLPARAPRRLALLVEVDVPAGRRRRGGEQSQAGGGLRLYLCAGLGGPMVWTVALRRVPAGPAAGAGRGGASWRRPEIPEPRPGGPAGRPAASPGAFGT